MQAEGGNRGKNNSGYDRRGMNVVQGAETSGGGWREVGGVDVEVDNVLYQERRLRAGINER